MRRGTTVGMLLIAVMVMFLSGCGKDRKNDTKEEEKPKCIPLSCDYKMYVYRDGERQLEETGSRDYDGDGRLLHALYETEMNSAGLHRKVEYTFEYDDIGRAISCKHTIIPLTGKKEPWAGVWDYHYTYYEDTDIVVERVSQLDDRVYQEKCEVGSDGTILSKTVNDHGTSRVEARYDPGERKVTWYDMNTSEEDQVLYTDYYDDSGRLIRRDGYKYGDFVYFEDKTTEYLYDGSSGICTEERSYDPSGKLVGVIRYDSEGRLIYADVRTGTEESWRINSQTVEWTKDPLLPGETVKVQKSFDKYAAYSEEIPDEEPAYFRESRYRKELLRNPDYVFYAGNVYQKDLGFYFDSESGTYYSYELYYQYVSDHGETTVENETSFYENGARKKETFIKHVYEDSGAWSAERITIEYDENGNPVKQYSTDEDGTETIQEEYEYTYR